MATTYEHSTTTTSSSEGVGLDRFYLKSLQGILKVAEIAVDLIAFICASVWLWWASHGGAWVQFVTMSAFITTLILYILHLFRIIYKLPGPWGLIELVYYAVYSLLMLIAAIVCASRGHYHSSIGAAAELIYYALYSLMLLIAAIVCAARGHYHSSIAAAAELVYYFLYSLMMLIAFIVCAARATLHGSVAAACFFTFLATALYIVDTFFLFRAWQEGRSGTSSSSATHTATTTTTETSYETKTQY